jgi:hypothetical protein
VTADTGQATKMEQKSATDRREDSTGVTAETNVPQDITPGECYRRRGRMSAIFRPFSPISGGAGGW